MLKTSTSCLNENLDLKYFGDNANSNEMWICDQEWQFDISMLMGRTRPNLCVWNFELPVNLAFGIKCICGYLASIDGAAGSKLVIQLVIL